MIEKEDEQPPDVVGCSYAFVYEMMTEVIVMVNIHITIKTICLQNASERNRRRDY